jgi:hypothetical protein
MFFFKNAVLLFKYQMLEVNHNINSYQKALPKLEGPLIKYCTKFY